MCYDRPSAEEALRKAVQDSLRVASADCGCALKHLSDYQYMPSWVHALISASQKESNQPQFVHNINKGSSRHEFPADGPTRDARATWSLPGPTWWSTQLPSSPAPTWSSPGPLSAATRCLCLWAYGGCTPIICQIAVHERSWTTVLSSPPRLLETMVISSNVYIRYLWVVE